MRKTTLPIALLTFALASTSALAQLDRCLEAHGALAKWRSYGTVEYDLKSKFGQKKSNDHQLFNLWTRDGVIQCDKYTLGSSGGDVWIKPGLDALGGSPARFYMWTPFYFFGMPFVFADKGAQQEALGKKSFQGKEYDALKITFGKGTGDTPDDYYLAYIDPATSQLKLSSYIVTYPSMRKDRPISELEPHAIIFEEWQTVDGLRVPKVAQFYKWNGHDIEGDPLGRLEYTDVHFRKEAPDETKFRKPADAVAAPIK